MFYTIILLSFRECSLIMVWEAEFMEGVAKYILAAGGTGGVKYLLPLA